MFRQIQALHAIGYDVGITNGGLYAAQLNLEQTVFNFTAGNALAKSSQADEDVTEQELQVERHTIKKQVTDLFLAALQTQQLLDVADDILERVYAQVNISAELVKTGLLKQTDFLLLQIELQNQTIQRSQLRSELRGDLNALFSSCGMTDTNLIQLVPMSEEIEQEVDPPRFIMTFEYDSMKAAAEQDVFESRYAPQVKVFFNTGLNAIEWENIDKRYGLSAGFNFSLPLYDGNQKSLSRQQHELLLENISSQKKYFLVQWSNQLKSLKEQIGMQKENLVLIEQQIAEFKDVLEISARNMQRGNLLVVEYLALLKNYSDVRKNKIVSHIIYLQLINNYNYWCW